MYFRCRICHSVNYQGFGFFSRKTYQFKIKRHDCYSRRTGGQWYTTYNILTFFTRSSRRIIEHNITAINFMSSSNIIVNIYTFFFFVFLLEYTRGVSIKSRCTHHKHTHARPLRYTYCPEDEYDCVHIFYTHTHTHIRYTICYAHPKMCRDCTSTYWKYLARRSILIIPNRTATAVRTSARVHRVFLARGSRRV